MHLCSSFMLYCKLQRYAHADIYVVCVCVCVNHVKGHVSTQIYEHLHLGKSYTDTDTRCCQPGE